MIGSLYGDFKTNVQLIKYNGHISTKIALIRKGTFTSDCVFYSKYIDVVRVVNFVDAFLLDPDQHFTFYIDFESVHALRPTNTLEKVF